MVAGRRERDTVTVVMGDWLTLERMKSLDLYGTQLALLGAGSGTKSLWSIGEFDQWILDQVDQKYSDAGGADKYYQAVPWLFRAVTLRAQAMAALPFDILDAKNDKVIDNSDDYKNVVQFFPHPEQTFWLMEASATLTGSSYFFNEQNRMGTLALDYLPPQEIKPKITPNGLEGFIRRVNNQDVSLTVEDVMYFWYLDPYIKLGPPRHYPAAAAMAASGVMFNLDAFVASFFKRGAIKTSVVAIEGNADKKERDAFKSRWQAAMQGIKNAWDSLIVNAKTLTVIPIGEGVKDLQNTELSAGKREDIAAALNIPYTLLFSGSASGLGGGSVVDADDLRFVQQFMIPEGRLFEDPLNDQLFIPNGYRLRFKPEALNVIQQNQSVKHSALTTMIAVLDTCSTYEEFQAASSMVHYQLDETTEKLVKTYFDQKQANADKIAAQMAQIPKDQFAQAPAPANATVTKPEPKQISASTGDAQQTAKALEVKQWKRFVANAIKTGKTDTIIHFQFKHLDAAEQTALVTGAQSNGDTSPAPFSLKTIGSVSQRFQAELTALVNEAWANEQGTITRDMRGLVNQYVEDAYFEGLMEGGSSPEQMTNADRNTIDDLEAEQQLYIAQFAKDVKDAAGDTAQQDSIRARIGLWAESIFSIGQRGWVSAQAKTKRRIQWHTAEDELVCPICGPLDGRIVDAGESFGVDGEGEPIYNEPAHPNCRCVTDIYIEAEGN